MAHLNKQLLIGNIGKDPEIKVTQSGNKKASFSLATTERFKDKTTGESKDKTEWHNVVAWGQKAEQIERLGLRKGVALYIEGKTTHRSWDDPSGQKKYMTEVELDSFQILTPKSSQGAQQPSVSDQTDYSQYGNTNSDDIPF